MSSTRTMSRRDALAMGGAIALGAAAAPAAVRADAPAAARGAAPPPAAVRGVGTSPGAATRVAPRAPALDVDRLIHPELRAAAEQIRQMAATMPSVSAATLAESRRGMERWVQPNLPDIAVETRTASVGHGTPDVQLIVVNAKPGASRPAILHTHGGGFVIGTARADVRDLQEIARTLDCVCVTVEYRLAPEATWQASTADNYAGLKWLYDHAAELGVDRARIALFGQSAGGGHAALLAIAARDRGEVPVAAQVLVYPMLDDRTGSSREVPAHIGTLLWTRDQNRFGWRSFLGMEPGTAKVPAAAVPARVASVSGLPPTFIGVGTLDLFVDEDVEYARRLIAAGVPTELVVVPGAFHGFDMIGADTAVARRFTAAKMDALRLAFRQSATPARAAAS